ncbi:MAG: glycosyltransferase family 2 protein [Candidatus Marsarchaeota archaeon]|nr:glycosyltransferase family 2 protein [Candidatus Marsarchaeota archaeon]
MQRGSSELISIIIPTFREEKNIVKVLQGVKKQLSGRRSEIIVVDDVRGKDKTAEIAKRMGARVLYDNVGKGAALIKGLKAAKGDVLVAMDADLSNEPKELALLIDAIDIGYDICTGSRFIIGGGSEDIPPFRVFGNKFFVFLVNVLFHANYTDMCYGYRSFRKGVPARLGLSEKGFGIETEINIKAIKNGFRVIEVPSTEKKRAAGEGKLRTFSDGWVILSTILKNIF